MELSQNIPIIEFYGTHPEDGELCDGPPFNMEYLYQSRTDGSTWVWDGGKYVVYVAQLPKLGVPETTIINHYHTNPKKFSLLWGLIKFEY